MVESGRDTSCLRVWSVRIIDSGITQIKAQGPSRACNESGQEEEALGFGVNGLGFDA